MRRFGGEAAALNKQLAATLRAAADLCCQRGFYLCDGSLWDPFDATPSQGRAEELPIAAIAVKSMIDALLPVIQQAGLCLPVCGRSGMAMTTALQKTCMILARHVASAPLLLNHCHCQGFRLIIISGSLSLSS